MSTNDFSRQSVNWLFLEGTAIVISILLAFSIDAWWQNRTDLIREQQYLAQLLSDAKENKKRLGEALLLEHEQQRSTKAILEALRSGVPLSIDSTRRWTTIDPGFMWYSDPRLLDGTISSLMSSGDINLIRDLTVRLAAIDYYGQLVADLDQFRVSVNQFLSHHDTLLSKFEQARTPDVLSGDDEIAHELISASKDKGTAVVFRLVAKNIDNRVWYLEQMLAANERFVAQLNVAGSR